MTPGDEDRELTRRFEELRRKDETTAPSFRQVLERPPARTRAPSLRSVVAVGGCVLVLWLLWLAGFSRHSRETQRTDARTVALGDWKSPTDFLLRTPGGELLDSRPALLERVPNYSDMESVKTEKGVRS